MSFYYRIIPLTDQFDDPFYPVLVEDVRQGNQLVSEVVIFEHDRIKGKFDFGKLEPIINHWPTPMVNRLKDEIKKAIF
ncbi:hypothetical protein [Bacillus sp. RS11]|uniref:hypothetical protein n=1 Tax=Lysinibacillus sp. RS11 TaxID=3242682 RepID=UPI0035C742C3